MGRPLMSDNGKGWRERFWTRVEKSEGCWNWTGSKAHYGYGSFWAWSRLLRAHRVSWVMHFGTIPPGMEVAHSCDNPSCVRPDHLYIADHATNMGDMARRNRQEHGERHHNASLNDDAVRQIKALKGQKFAREVAESFGVTRWAIFDIWRGRTWVHVS